MAKKSNDLSKGIARVISFFPKLSSNVKLELKDQNAKLKDIEFEELKKEYSTLEAKRKKHVAEVHYKTETNLHKTRKLKAVYGFLMLVSIIITILGTNAFDTIMVEGKQIKSLFTICLVFGFSVLNYFLSSQLLLIKNRFYVLFYIASGIIMGCLFISVFFNYMFLLGVITVQNIFIKHVISLLMAVLLDLGIVVLLIYENGRKTLSFTYQNQNKRIRNINSIPEVKPEDKPALTEPKQIKTETLTDKTESKQNPDFKTELITDKTEDEIEEQDDKTVLTYEQIFKQIYNRVQNIEPNARISKTDFPDIDFVKTNRYDWDKTIKELKKQNLVYTAGKTTRKLGSEPIALVK